VPLVRDVAEGLEESLVQAIEAAEKSVVAIARVRRGDSEIARGSPLGALADPDPTDPSFIPNEFATGVIIDSDGLIVTNQHVLRHPEDSDFYITTVDRRTFRAEIFATDPRSDLAVLKVDASDLAEIRLGDAASLAKGQIVLALGNPYAIARDGQVSASWGIISNLHRKAPADPSQGAESAAGNASKSTLHHFGTLIQTDAKLNWGTSGGALIDRHGQMIGLTTSTAALEGYETAAGYAIPVDATFRRALEQLRQGREVEYGFLGVAPNNLSLAERAQGMFGVRVDRVFQGTPAETAGIREKDVVTHVEGEPVYDVDMLFLNVGRLAAESEVQLSLIRPPGVRRQEVKARLVKFRVSPEQIVSVRDPAWRGLRVDYPTAMLTLRSGDSVPKECVIVTDVEAESPAWRAGVRPGTQILELGSQTVDTPRKFRELTQNLTGSVRVRLREREILIPAS
jgi:serine protease Do